VVKFHPLFIPFIEMNYLEEFKTNWKVKFWSTGDQDFSPFNQIDFIYDTLVNNLRLNNFNSSTTSPNDYLTGLLNTPSINHYLKVLEIAQLIDQASKTESISTRLLKKNLSLDQNILHDFILELKFADYFKKNGFVVDLNHSYKPDKPCDLLIQKGEFKRIVEVSNIKLTNMILFYDLQISIQELFKSLFSKKIIRSESNMICEILFFKINNKILKSYKQKIINQIKNYLDQFNDSQDHTFHSFQKSDKNYQIDIKMNPLNWVAEFLPDNHSKSNIIFTLNNVISNKTPSLSLKSFFVETFADHESIFKRKLNDKIEQHPEANEKMIYFFGTESIQTLTNLHQMGIFKLKEFLQLFFNKHKLNNYWVFVNNFTLLPNHEIKDETYFVVDDKEYFKSIFPNIEDLFILEVSNKISNNPK